MKKDIGKLRWDFIPWDALGEVVKVFTFGHTVKGYDEEGWKHCKPAVYKEKALRHFMDWLQGKKHDDESGFFTLAHVIFNVLCLLWFDLCNETNKKTQRDKIHADELKKVMQGMNELTGTLDSVKMNYHEREEQPCKCECSKKDDGRMYIDGREFSNRKWSANYCINTRQWPNCLECIMKDNCKYNLKEIGNV